MWILFIFVIGGYHGTSSTINSQEFNTKESCMTAAQYLKSRAPTDIANHPIYSFSCVQK